jgi:ferredoxin-NADP reductase
VTRFGWRPARVVEIERATARMISLAVEPEAWIPHAPGQHYEIRFPGEELSRKFSIASAPEAAPVLEFGIQVLDYGLLSPRLAAARPGDHVELRGPTGAGFNWSADAGGPLLLLGGGAGITPLLAMYDHHRAQGTGDSIVFLLSARRPDLVYRRYRLGADVTFRFTDTEPRFDKSAVARAVEPVLGDPHTAARICGPKGFMESMVEWLLELGVCEDRVRSEAFT